MGCWLSAVAPKLTLGPSHAMHQTGMAAVSPCGASLQEGGSKLRVGPNLMLEGLAHIDYAEIDGGFLAT